MKVNEAPEKIFLEREKETNKIHHLWGRTPVVSSFYEHIEYTRTDAFFNKASIWFNNNLGHDECGVISYSFDTEEEMFKDFIEYMKGE